MTSDKIMFRLMLKFKDKKTNKNTARHHAFNLSCVVSPCCFLLRKTSFCLSQLEADAKRDFEMALKSGIPGEYLPNCWYTMGFGSVGAIYPICTPIKASNKFHVKVEKICSDSTWSQRNIFFLGGVQVETFKDFKPGKYPKKSHPKVCLKMMVFRLYSLVGYVIVPWRVDPY